MNIIKAIMLKAMLAQLASIVTDKGELQHEGEIAEGVDVFVLGEDGEPKPAEDGEYATEDKVIVVKDGKVVEIKEVDEPQEEHQEKVVAEDAVPAAPAEEQPVEAPAEDKDAKIASLEALVEELKQSLSEMEAQMAELKTLLEEKDARIREMEEKEATPVQEPATVAAAKQEKPRTGLRFEAFVRK